ncbi:MAG: LUD domain-containing protein [Candidatus Pacearchaeota archaeon]
MKKIDLEEEIEKNEINRKKIVPIMYSYKERRDDILSKKSENFKEEIRKIKEYSIDNLNRLKDKAILNLSKNGIRVIEAKDSSQAIKEVLKIIGEERIVVKSKSNTINEINLKEALKDKELVETDIGDFVTSLFEDGEIHPVLPAVNLSPEEISKKIKEKFNVKLSNNPEEIIQFIKNYLRGKILEAKIGITGANAISSDGSIFILENEGNISLISRIPDKHIIIAGIDKIVEKREEALKVIEASGIFGTGQEYPVYTNIISGPSKTADIQNKLVTGAQGAKEVYIILLDNNRSNFINTKFKEILYCINCGSCLNFCPVYHQIFTRYGSKYFPGAKGVILSYYKENPDNAYYNGAFFCTTCHQCFENCPVKINLSNLVKELRKDLVKNKIEPPSAKEMIENIEKYGNPFGKVEAGKKIDKLYCC